MDRMNKDELIKLIESLGMNKEDFVVLSSGGLVLREIMDSAADLDISVTSSGLDYLKSKYDLKKKESGFYQVNEKVECIEDNKTKKELVGSYYVQDINDYLNWIKNSNREKDKVRISMVEEYIRTR